MSFVRDLMSPMRLLSTKCNDAPQSNVMVDFSVSGVAEPARNETLMSDRGDSLTYDVRTASDQIGVGGAVDGASGAATGVDGAVTTGEAGEEAMNVGKDVPLAVTAVLARPVLETSP